MNEMRFRTIITNIVIVAVLGVLAMTAALTITNSDDPIVENVNNTAIYRGSDSAGAVSLMVNVYEGTQYVLQIADILSSYGFKTTFFVGGRWVERNSDALIQIAAKGMEIGNHGYLHRDAATLNYKQNTDEILLTQKLITATLSDLALQDGSGWQLSKLFAPPSGSYGNTMFKVCSDLNYTVVMWSRDTIDWRDHDADVIYSRAVRNLAAGDLILMHPTAATVEALPRILDYIVAQGLNVATVSEVI